MKLELVKSNKTVVLEELDKLANPVEPIETGVDVTDVETAEEDTEKINKEVNKRVKDIEKNALAVKGEDHAEEPKLVKESKEFKKEERKELGAFIRELRENKIKHHIRKSTTEGYRYTVEYLREETLTERGDKDPIDMEALEAYANMSEGDNITVTADLLNVLEQALEMAKKHGLKESEEEVEVASEEEETESEGEEPEKFVLIVKDNENIEEDSKECPLPLEVIPNSMGINLSNVEKIEWEKFEDGQLKEVEIKFNPATEEEKVEQGEPAPEEGGEEVISTEEETVEESKVVENLEESIDFSKEIWEGWTVQDFIDELEPLFNQVVAKKSFRKPFANKEELKKWCAEEQPYYKKSIPEVVEYFDKKIKELGGYEKLGEGFISGSEKLSFEELASLEEGLFRELKNVGIYPEDGTFSNSSNHLADLELTLLIDGDWKHDHLAAEKIVEKFCKENGLSIVKHEADEVGHSDSDWYEAEHRWYLIKDVDGKMDDTIARLKKMFEPKEEDDIEEESLEESKQVPEVKEPTKVEESTKVDEDGEPILEEKEIINPADVEEDDVSWFTGE